MPSVLPSAESCYDKTDGMRPEALGYRNELFQELTKELKLESECADMFALLKQQTRDAENKTIFIGDSWSGIPAVSKHAAELETNIAQDITASREDAAARIAAIQETGTQAIRMDLAVGEDAKILVGYDLPTDAAKGDMATLFNDFLYTEEKLVTEDSQILQATTKTDVLKDEKGSALPATRAQIDNALSAMGKALQEKGIALEVVDHNYQEVDKAIHAEGKTEEPTAKVQQQPEDRTRPT